MLKTRRMLELERQHDRPIEDIVADAINRTGSIAGAARELGLTTGALWEWVHLRLRIDVRTLAIAPKR